MTKRLRLPATLRKHNRGEKTIELAGGTLQELLTDLRSRYPAVANAILDDDDQLHSYIQLYIDGESYQVAHDSGAALSDDVQLTLIAPVAGG